MCRASAYDLRYEINDWMHLDNRPDRTRALQQWDELYQILTEKLGVEVSLVPQAEECPDMVFTANAGLVVGRRAVVSRFKHVERQAEEPYFREHLRSLGFETVDLEAPAGQEIPAFEGEGDALRAGKYMVAGYGLRTDRSAHEQLGSLVRDPLLSVELVDGRWYHLDTCFLPLSENQVFFYPGAFSPESVQALRATFRCFEVDPEEALRFACNAVVIGDAVVLPADCPKLCRDLEGLGYRCFSVPMTEFIKAGGACKCLTLYL